MIQKVLTKYGLAIHLAVLAALPVALTPFLAKQTLGTVVLWLGAFGLLWLLVEPSLRNGEHLSLARYRVRRSILRDPFFYLLIFLLVVALTRALNSGVALFYDAETANWLVRPSSFSALPSSAADSAVLPLTVTISMAIVILGIRHGLGLNARISFGLVGAAVTALGAIAAAVCVCLEIPEFERLAKIGFEKGNFIGPLFASWLIIGIACGVQAEARKWKQARLPLSLIVAGNVTGILLFSPAAVSVVWFAATILMSLFCLGYLGRAASMGAVVRVLVLLVFGSAAAFFLFTLAPESIKAVKTQGLDFEMAFSESFKQSSAALSRIARSLWQANLWSGAGLGTYGLHVPFLAEKAEWAVLSAQPAYALNSYWTLLSERGIFGCLLLAMAFGMLVVTYFVRFFASFAYLRHEDDADVFVFAVPPIVWTIPVIIVLYFVEAVWTPLFSLGTIVYSLAVPLALGAASFPRPRVKADNGNMSESEVVSEK